MVKEILLLQKELAKVRARGVFLNVIIVIIYLSTTFHSINQDPLATFKYNLIPQKKGGGGLASV